MQFHNKYTWKNFSLTIKIGTEFVAVLIIIILIKTGWIIIREVNMEVVAVLVIAYFAYQHFLG